MAPVTSSTQMQARRQFQVGFSYRYQKTLNGEGAHPQAYTSLTAGVLVGAGKTPAEAWETMTSHGLTVPLLITERCGLVTDLLLPEIQVNVPLHTGEKVMWTVGGKDQGVKVRAVQNEVKCPQGVSARWTLMPLEVSMWFMASSRWFWILVQERGKDMEQEMEVAQGFYTGRLEVGGLASM